MNNENKLPKSTINLLWANTILGIGGLLYLLLDGFFGWETWERLYWWWEAAMFILLSGTILNLIPKPYRWIIKPFFIYSIIRLLWEITFLLTGLDVNHPKAVITASLILITGSAMLLLKDLTQRLK